MTDDKEDKTLEHQEHFTEVAKSRDVEVLEGKLQYIEFAGNLVPITKSGEQLSFSFRAFRENRLPFTVRVKDQHAEAVSRCLFMKESKVRHSEAPFKLLNMQQFGLLLQSSPLFQVLFCDLNFNLDFLSRK